MRFACRVQFGETLILFIRFAFVRSACRVQFESPGVGVGVVCMVGETGSRGEWMMGSGVPEFTLFGSVGMFWTTMMACRCRSDCELAGKQALVGTNLRDSCGWDGERRVIGWGHGGGRALVVGDVTSLYLLEWDCKDGSHQGKERDGSECLHVGVWVRDKSKA